MAARRTGMRLARQELGDQPGAQVYLGVDSAQWAGSSFLAPGLVLYLGSGAAADEHAHHAIQVVWGLDKPVELTIAGQHLQARATIIPAGVPHRFDAQGGRLALALVDAHGRRGVSLGRACTDVIADLESLPLPAGDLSAAQAFAWCDGLFARLGLAEEPEELSPSVKRALTYLDHAITGTPRLPEAARFARVSPGVLTHAFSRQVGIPFRRFVLWLRIKRAVDEVRGGATLTEAAVAAGFSDSAHLSRVFRANFGLAPSTVLHRMTFAGALWGTAEQPQRSSPQTGW